MAHGPSMGSLVLPNESRRGGMALPLSLTAHAAFIAAVLALSHAGRPELPGVRAIPPDGLVLRVARADPPPAPVVVTPAAAPRPQRTSALPAPAAPAAPTTAAAGQIAVPIDVPDTLPTADATGGCVGCAIGMTGVEPGGGPDPGPGTGPGTGPGAGSAPRPIGGQITAPVKLRHVDPAYPALARQIGVRGTVVIECVIDTAGNVVEARVVSGPPLLTAAALEAVRQWKYRPTLLNGAPVSIIMSVTVQFHLR